MGAEGDLHLGLSPNPVHGFAYIHVSLPEPSRMYLSVYDVSGHEIVAGDLGAAPSGELTLPWNPRDPSGGRLTPGMYFYKVDAIGRDTGRHLTSCQKFLLIR
jgi:hypothetical protein